MKSAAYLKAHQHSGSGVSPLPVPLTNAAAKGLSA